jgi:hypothetical protein
MAFVAYAANIAHHRRAFVLTVNPARQTVVPGAIARYRVVIYRHRFKGRIVLRVRGGVPRNAGAKIRYLRHSRSIARLTAFTTLHTRPGRYRLRIRAVHGRRTATLRVVLVVAVPRPASFTGAGDVLAPLEPGMWQPVDVVLSNPNRASIEVTNLATAVERVSAPNATPSQPCSLADFAVQQYTGSYPLTIPGLSSRSLVSLGVPEISWPEVQLVNRPVNQDGCQGATVTLAYGGTAGMR